ncbi:MAG: hypothetical protein ACKV2Q_30885 [Planctomycetaceae bacterium]
MRARQLRWVIGLWIIGLWGLSLGSTVATAQSPSESAYPSSRADELSSQSVDGWNRDWQWRFSADAVYMRRDNRSRDVPVIDGPERQRLGDLNFDYQYGTRLSLSVMDDDYEFEATFLSVKDRDEGRGGALTHGLDFDGSVVFGAAVPGAQSAVDPDLVVGPNFLTTGTYFAPLNAAANAGSELDALDFLQTGATFQTQYKTDFQDFEANYKQRDQPGRWLRWGLGFRNVTVRENGIAALSGTFGSVDANGIGAPSTVGLPSAALMGAGLIFSTGTNDGFLAGDTLLFSSRTRTENRLYGLQGVAEMKWLESDYFDLGGFGKLGVYYNDVSGSINEQYAGTGSSSSIYTRSLRDDKTAVSFVGHAGLTGRVYLRRNIRIVGGYEALYLAGLALAPDQVQAITTPVSGAASLDLRTDSTMFIHGGRVGLEILFP